MKILTTIFFVFSLLSCLSQTSIVKKDLQKINTSKLTFLLESDSKQTLNWDTIYSKKIYLAQIINNTKDTVYLVKKSGYSSSRVMWYVNDNTGRFFPNDTIKLAIKIITYQDHYKLNGLIKINYHTSSNSNYCNIYTRGYLIDSARIKHTELNMLKKDPNNEFYDTGELKNRRNPNPQNDTIPFFTSYYKNGVIKQENYSGNGITIKTYNESGLLKRTWDKEGPKTTYYSNGNLKFKRGSDPYSLTEPYNASYFGNGCIKKEVYMNETITKKYDSIKCGQLIDITTLNKSEEKVEYGKIITHYKKGRITGKSYQIHGCVNEANGEYIQDQLMDGKVSYYSQNNTLLFEIKIQNGCIDSTLSKGEKQGKQINLVNERGEKMGIWVTSENTKQPINLTKDFTQTYQNTEGFEHYLYEYKNGDTMARITLHNIGGIEGYFYIRNKKKRQKEGRYYFKFYHENGFLSGKSYSLKNGLKVNVSYSQSTNNKMIGGTKSNTGQLYFENNRLVKIISRDKKIVTPEVFDILTSSNEKENKGEYCVEKGFFRQFELYNGFIYYYNSDSSRRLTEKVVNGVIQGNSKVNFTEAQLKTAALINDLNFNGWVERRELKGINNIRLQLSKKELDFFKWDELKYFKNLTQIMANNRIYKLSDYANYTDLKLAILNEKGKPISRQRWSWEPPVDAEPPSISEIIDFPKIEARFPGGKDSLIIWLNKNIKHPQSDLEEIYGTVYIKFIVLKDGSLTSIEIKKGLRNDYDLATKELIKNMPKWEPAQSDGKKIESRMILPIKFKLNSD